MKLKTDLQQI